MPGNPSSPIRTQEIALRNAYAEGDPQRCAAHHLNLANQQEAANGEPRPSSPIVWPAACCSSNSARICTLTPWAIWR